VNVYALYRHAGGLFAHVRKKFWKGGPPRANRNTSRSVIQKIFGAGVFAALPHGGPNLVSFGLPTIAGVAVGSLSTAYFFSSAAPAIRKFRPPDLVAGCDVSISAVTNTEQRGPAPVARTAGNREFTDSHTNDIFRGHFK